MKNNNRRKKKSKLQRLIGPNNAPPCGQHLTTRQLLGQVSQRALRSLFRPFQPRRESWTNTYLRSWLRTSEVARSRWEILVLWLAARKYGGERSQVDHQP